jgi:seryl-tRNA synthetase
MLDIKFIRENAGIVKKAIVDKGADLDLDELLEIDERRRVLMAETETLQATKNSVSKEIPNLSPSDRAVKILEMKEVDSKQESLQAELKEVESKFHALMLLVPNIPSPEAPIGKDESENVPKSYWSPELGVVDAGDAAKVAKVPTKFDFEVKDHITLGKSLDLIDIEKGVQTSGFRGYYLKNEAVLMQYGLMWHALKKMQEKGFMLMAPPVLVREHALIGSGHFPAGKEEIYRVGNAASFEDEAGKEPIFLAGTSEPSLLAYYADTILDESQLPIQVCGITPCFRSEIGSYGKDTKGIYRIHEFMKVEQMVVCKADIAESRQWHEKLLEIGEEILQELKLPYRVLDICTGDMGAPKYKQYDIETWMPSRESYGETHSDSNLTDWQARRLNIRYRDSEGKIQHAYTLNNTAVASPRILIPLLENYQQADGSVVVPEVLRPYVGTDIINPK